MAKEEKAKAANLEMVVKGNLAADQAAGLAEALAVAAAVDQEVEILADQEAATAPQVTKQAFGVISTKKVQNQKHLSNRTDQKEPLYLLSLEISKNQAKAVSLMPTSHRKTAYPTIK